MATFDKLHNLSDDLHPSDTESIEGVQPMEDMQAPMDGTQRAPTVPHRVVKLSNGLVDISKGPEYLFVLANRNASQSPLLRLPREIRDRIWDFTFDTDIQLYAQYDPDESEYTVKGRAVNQDNEYYDIVESGLRLPEVCRQTYAETSVLIYKRHLFTCLNRWPFIDSYFLAAWRLMIADGHWQEIRVFQPYKDYVVALPLDGSTAGLQDRHKPSHKEYLDFSSILQLPRLERFYVGGQAMRDLKSRYELFGWSIEESYIKRKIFEEFIRTKIAHLIKSKGGAHLQVIFREGTEDTIL